MNTVHYREARCGKPLTVFIVHVRPSFNKHLERLKISCRYCLKQRGVEIIVGVRAHATVKEPHGQLRLACATCQDERVEEGQVWNVPDYIILRQVKALHQPDGAVLEALVDAPLDEPTDIQLGHAPVVQNPLHARRVLNCRCALQECVGIVTEGVEKVGVLISALVEVGTAFDVLAEAVEADDGEGLEDALGHFEQMQSCVCLTVFICLGGAFPITTVSFQFFPKLYYLNLRTYPTVKYGR